LILFTRLDDGRTLDCGSHRPSDSPVTGVHPGAPVQPYSIRDDAYLLFLGNEVYLLACPARCDPAAVFPVNQH
jgi:hypothetical protein